MTDDGIPKEALPHMACVERGGVEKIERGEHMPTLVMILRIARALEQQFGRTAA